MEIMNHISKLLFVYDSSLREDRLDGRSLGSVIYLKPYTENGFLHVLRFSILAKEGNFTSTKTVIVIS